MQADLRVKECQTEFDDECRAEEQREIQRLEVEAKQISAKKHFFDSIEASKDLNDNLEQLVNFIQENTGATGVYVGQLVSQKKAIQEDAGVDDDLDQEAPKVIQFTHATASHKAMLNVVLTPEQAPMSHSVFNFVETEAQPPAEEAA